MWNKRSPSWTISPSLKGAVIMKPDTRARISTVLSASNRPVKSWYSVTSLVIGVVTSTATAFLPSDCGGAVLHPAHRTTTMIVPPANLCRVQGEPPDSAAIELRTPCWKEETLITGPSTPKCQSPGKQTDVARKYVAISG